MHVVEELLEVIPSILELIVAMWFEGQRPAPPPRTVPEDKWKVPDAAVIARVCGRTHDGD